MRWKVSVLMLCVSLCWSAQALAQTPTSDGGDLNAVQALSVDEADDGTYIRIEGTEEATFSVFKLDDPPRLFVDLSNSELADGELAEQVYNGVISTVHLVEFEDGFQEAARLVVGFEEPAHYDVRTEGSEVVVFIDGDGRDAGEDAVAVDDEELQQREAELAEARARLEGMERRYEQEVQEQRQDYQEAVDELETTRGELSEAKQELAAMREQRDEASGEELQQLEAAIATHSEALDEAQADVEQREAQVDRLQTAMSELEAERDAQVEQLQTAMRELKAERDQERARYEEARKRAQKAERGAEQAREQAQQARQEQQKAHAEVQALERRLQEMDSEVDGAEARIAEQRQQLQQAQARAERLERELQRDRAQQREQASDDSSDDEAQAMAEQRQRQLEQRQQQLEQAQRKARQAEQQVAQAQAEREEWRQARQRYQNELEEVRAQARQAEAETQRLSEAIAERDAEIERLEQQVQQADTEEERQQLAEAISARDEEIERLQRQLDEVTSGEQEREQLREAIAERDAEIERLEQQVQQADTEEERQQLRDAVAQRDAEIEKLQERAGQVPTHEDAREAKAVPVDPSDENSIQSVRLETNEQGRSQIVVDLDRPGQFQTSDTGATGRSVMILNDVALPPELERTLSADSEGGVVRFVSSYAEDDGSVRMEADLRGESSEVIRQDGNQVVWEFAPEMTPSPRHADGDRNAPGPLEAQSRPERPTEGESVTSAPPNYPQVVSDPTSVTRVPGMGTRPITIDLRNADIENVLRLISSESGVNIIAGDDVSGNVTMKLQGVAMDEAFLTILQSLRLGYEIRGNVLRVAPQSVLNEEEQARAEARARAQEMEPLEVFLLPVNYAAAGDLTAQVEGLLSPRGSVSVDDRTNTLIIKDLSDNLQSIRMLIETLDAQVPQVLIEARIVETNEAFDRELGIQWGGDFSMSQGGGNPTGLVFPNVFGVSGGATDGEAPVEGTSENPNYAVNLPAAAGTGAGGAMGLTMGSVGGSVNLNLRLSAMEAAGYAKIISSPRILTLDNRQATISQGTSIPISVVSAAGVQTIFVDATLELTVTPHVTPDGNVRMSIEATKNEPDFQNTGAQGDPTIIQNQAETELLVADGDTTVIGGIYTENTGQSISAVPFLHRIPILGFLFRSHSETENRSELLIFITPRIVNRAEALGVMSTGSMGQ